MKQDYSEYVGHSVHRIARELRILHNENLEKKGITFSQFRVLRALWKEDGLTQKEIQERLDIKPSSVTGLIDLLVKKGLVSRRPDERDARLNRVFVTHEGEDLKRDSWEIHEQLEAILTRGFSKEEKALLLSWLHRIHENLFLRNVSE